jgi:ketosteroid isomerase-like protein
MDRNIEQEILAQEENLTQATRNLDIQALDSIYANDIMVTGVTGEVCGKNTMIEEARQGIAQREAAIAAGKKFVSSYDKEDIKVVSHGNVAISSYRFVVKIKGDGIDVNRWYRTTNVWMKRQAQWQVIAAHTASLELDLSKL